MKRIYKNIISIVMLLIGVGIITVSIVIANNTKTFNNQNNGNSMSEPPQRLGENNSKEPPQRLGDDNSNEPPQKPSENNSNEPPQKPSEDNSNNDSENKQNQTGLPEIKNNDSLQLVAKDSVKKLTIGYIITIIFGSLLISISLIYLIMSIGGLKQVFISFDKGLIFVLITIIVTAIISYGTIYYANNNILLPSSVANNNQINNSSNINYNGKKNVTGNETLNDTYTSTTNDENAILVSNNANALIENATVEKSGDSSNTESSDFYGTNAGILTTQNSTSTIKNTTIATNGKGANAIFATGENAKVYVSDTTIKTTGESSSRGLDATYGGYIEGNNLNIITQGGSSATLATDRGEGTVKVTDSTLETNGSGSPIIYSTGNITISNTTGTANNSQMVVVEGKNSATVSNSKLFASGKGNRSSNADQAGVMIYQSMSGDASEGTGTFSSVDSSLNILSSSKYYKTAPMFFVTNTDAVINLENTKLKFGSGILLSAKGTSEWGKSGSNGANVTLNATKQTLTGNIEIDSISTLTLNLKDSSTYKGSINSDNSAKSVTVNLSSNSKWTLTGNTYISKLNDDDTTYSNIDLNGYKLYINGKELSK